MARTTSTGEEIAPVVVTATTPENQAASFRGQDRVWPVRAIRRGEAVRPLPPHARSAWATTRRAFGPVSPRRSR